MLYPNGRTTRPRVTSSYGWRIHPLTGLRKFHFGTDSVDHEDGFNHAPEAGVVVFARYNGGNGNEVRIQGKTRLWKLFHHSRIDVKVGQLLAVGARTGPTGTTGASTGIHCHGECWRNSTSQDPFAYIAANLGGGGAGGGGITTPEEEIMSILVTAKDQPGKPTFHVAPGLLHRISGGEDGELGPFREATGLTREDKSDADFMGAVTPFGFEHLTLAQIVAIPAGATYQRPASTVPPIDYKALAAELAPLMPAPPTVEEIAAEVIRQQKLPGN